MGDVFNMNGKRVANPKPPEPKCRAICQRCEFVHFASSRRHDPMSWQCGATGRYCTSENYNGECRLFSERKPRQGFWSRLFGARP